MSNLPTHAGAATRTSTIRPDRSATAAAQRGAPPALRPLIAAGAGVPALKPHQVSARAAYPVAALKPGGAPQWVELLPAGEFVGRDGRGPFKLENPGAVIAATQARALKAGLPIDYDHATDFAAPAGSPAPAAGWISAFAVREGAIWGRAEWTPRAAAAIGAREYRYLSPVFEYSRDTRVVTRLLRAGLTNNPNLYLTAICAVGSEDNAMEELLNKLREMLGLAADAAPEEILAAVARALESRAEMTAQADPARYVAVAELQKALTELNTMRAERARERSTRLVDEAIAAGKLIPAQRDWALSYCSADSGGFQAFAARQPALFGAAPALEGSPERDRGGARALNRIESAVCAQLGLSAERFVAHKAAGADFLNLNRSAINQE